MHQAEILLVDNKERSNVRIWSILSADRFLSDWHEMCIRE
jgi:hypothetical protein